MTEPTFLDGNAMAGALGEVFAVDVTTAMGRCDGCGSVAVLAEAHVFMDAPGAVVRCAGCDSVLLRVVSAPGRTWLRPPRPLLPPARHPTRPLTREAKTNFPVDHATLGIERSCRSAPPQPSVDHALLGILMRPLTGR